MNKRNEMYQDRAEWADMESEIADAKKYVRVGGLLWRLFSWLERHAQRGRAEVQAEIDDLNRRERRM